MSQNPGRTTIITIIADLAFGLGSYFTANRFSSRSVQRNGYKNLLQARDSAVAFEGRLSFRLLTSDTFRKKLAIHG